MIRHKALVALTLSTLLSGCFETKEDIEARQSQFNGSSVAQVSAVIGKPIAQDRAKAIWQYKNTYRNRVPIQHYMNGKWITSGYRTETVKQICTYTATLSAGRITASTYAGNSCTRLAPKLRKKE